MNIYVYQRLDVLTLNDSFGILWSLVVRKWLHTIDQILANLFVVICGGGDGDCI